MIEKIKAPINILPIDLVEQVTPALALAKLIEKVNYIIDIINEMGGYQPKHDDELNTEDKTVVGAINELLEKLNTALQELDTEIENILNTKQSKEDDALTTEDKTIVGAINELKGSIQGFVADIQNLINNKQNKEDDTLTTEVKTIVGAINEVNGKANNLNDTKQDKTDDTLETTNKTIVGAINEVNGKANRLNDTKQNKTDGSLIGYNHNLVNAINNHSQELQNIFIRLNSITNDLSSLQNLYVQLYSTKQDKTDNTLQTEAKTIVGAINEINNKTKELFYEVADVITEYNLDYDDTFWNVKVYFENNKKIAIPDGCLTQIAIGGTDRFVTGLDSLEMKSIPYDIKFIIDNEISNYVTYITGQFNYIQGFEPDLTTEYGRLTLDGNGTYLFNTLNDEIQGFQLIVDRQITEKNCQLIGITPQELFNGLMIHFKVIKLYN